MNAAAWKPPVSPEVQASPRGQGGRLVLMAALLVVAASGASLGLEALEGRAWFPLKTVRFDGDLAHVREADLQAAVSPHMGRGLFGIDVAAIRGSVEALPWVAGAAVRRVWPNALRITVSEHRPVARWGDSALLNPDAGVFRPEHRPADLPGLDGPQGTAGEVLATFRWLQRQLAATDLALTGVALDRRRSWRATLAGGGELVIGREHREARVARLTTAWPHLRRAGRTPALIDLRYPNGFAIRWQAADATGDSNAPKG